MAEGMGFEPTSDFRRCRFSRPRHHVSSCIDLVQNGASHKGFRTFIYDMRKNFRAFVPRIFSTDSGASEDSRSRVLLTGSTKPSACG